MLNIKRQQQQQRQCDVAKFGFSLTAMQNAKAVPSHQKITLRAFTSRYILHEFQCTPQTLNAANAQMRLKVCSREYIVATAVRIVGAATAPEQCGAVWCCAQQ